MTPIGRRGVCLRLGAIVTVPLWPVWRAVADQQTGLDRRALLFQSGVDLVHLSVTARNSAGGLVHDLGVADFEILEDGTRQEVGHFGHHETPISVVLLLDTSSSMMGDKLMHAKDGVITFVKALKTGDEVLVITFSESVDALGGFGLSARTVEQAIKQVEVESVTRLYDAVIEGAREIASPGRKDKRALVILSDGEDTSSRARLNDAVDAVRAADVPVYAIAIEYGNRGPWYARRPSSNWRQLRAAGEIAPLRQLTDGTGGWTYPIQAAERCKEVCLRIAEELRNQYVLGYYSSTPERDGRWRAIEVRSSRPGVTLTTRAGYYARLQR